MSSESPPQERRPKPPIRPEAEEPARPEARNGEAEKPPMPALQSEVEIKPLKLPEAKPLAELRQWFQQRTTLELFLLSFISGVSALVILCRVFHR